MERLVFDLKRLLNALLLENPYALSELFYGFHQAFGCFALSAMDPEVLGAVGLCRERDRGGTGL